jgi:hypothetical protein
MVNLLELKLGLANLGWGITIYQRNLLLAELGLNPTNNVVLHAELMNDVDGYADHSDFNDSVYDVHAIVLHGLGLGIA